MKKFKKVFFTFSFYRQPTFCGINVCYNRERDVVEYSLLYFLSEGRRLVFKFTVDLYTFESKNFDIFFMEYEDIKVYNNCINRIGDLSESRYAELYNLFFDFASKHGFPLKERTYSSLNKVIMFFLYLYCLNNFYLDCRDFNLSPYSGEKNSVLFNEIGKIICEKEKQKV